MHFLMHPPALREMPSKHKVSITNQPGLKLVSRMRILVRLRWDRDMHNLLIIFEMKKVAQRISYKCFCATISKDLCGIISWAT